MKKFFTKINIVYSILLAVVIFIVASPVQAIPLTNGDFSAGLTGWDTLGNVSEISEEAVLTDNQSTYSKLTQVVSYGVGNYTLEFDIFNGLSENILDDTFSFPDVFFATLSASNATETFGLFDLDASGFSNVNGTITTSPKGFQWAHFATSFSINLSSSFAPLFELFDFNFIDNDSLVKIDNVVLTSVIKPVEVPEPSTIALLSISAVSLLRKRKKGHPQIV